MMYATKAVSICKAMGKVCQNFKLFKETTNFANTSAHPFYLLSTSHKPPKFKLPNF